MILEDFLNKLDYTPSECYIISNTKKASDFIELDESNFDKYKKEIVSHSKEYIRRISYAFRPVECLGLTETTSKIQEHSEVYIFLEPKKKGKK